MSRVTETASHRILVIDDEPAMGRLVRRYLEPRHQITFEQHAADAFARLRSGEPFDVILCDVIMPRLSGAAFFRQLQVVLPEHCQRLVFMTGGARNSEALAFLDMVPNRRIDKPFSLRVLELELLRLQMSKNK